MRGYRGAKTMRRQATSSLVCAAMPASVLRVDEIEGTSPLFGNHQWKPNADVEPPM